MIHDNRNLPLVSIIIVNFNGHKLLDSCLSSLLQLDFPQAKLEVILVDNNSSDDSVPFVKKHFPWVKLVQNAENLGFSGGNIAGFNEAKGKYIVLLNSDVTVDKNWLTSMVEKADDPKVGIVASRLRYAIPFIELEIESSSVPRSKVFQTIDHSPIGVMIEEIQCESESLSESVYYKKGFYEKQEGEICTRRTMGNALVLLPFTLNKQSNSYLLTMHGLESTEAVPISVNLKVNGENLRSLELKPHETIQVELKVAETIAKKDYRWLIQNAGNAILHSGYGKDRGSVVVLKEKEQKEFYEEESEYFLKSSELLSACGASCLIKRKVIEHVGFLDGNYFMYYEDVELCIRAWRAGWQIAYEPNSIGYHKHRATTGNNESPFFLNLVERNHIALLITHFPLQTVFNEVVLFALRYGITVLKYMVFRFRDNEVRSEIWRKKYEGRSEAMKFVLSSWYRLLKNRLMMNKYWPMNFKELEKMTY